MYMLVQVMYNVGVDEYNVYTHVKVYVLYMHDRLDNVCVFVQCTCRLRTKPFVLKMLTHVRAQV